MKNFDKKISPIIEKFFFVTWVSIITFLCILAWFLMVGGIFFLIKEVIR